MVWQAYYQNSAPHALSPVGSFWWRDVCKLFTTFRSITYLTPGVGKSILFWKDCWHDDLMAVSFPRIFSFALDTDISLKSMLSCGTLGDLARHFAIPVSVQALVELQQIAALLVILKQNELDRVKPDSWTFMAQNGRYSSAAYYKFMFADLEVSPIFRKLWKSKSLHKPKVFVWLLLVDRLNTRDLIDRRHWHLNSGVNCALCGQWERETREHLFFNCSFAIRVWHKLGIIWATDPSMATMFERAKLTFQGPKFIQVATCALWGIWKIRNSKVFEGKQPLVQTWRMVFKHDIGLIVHRVKPIHKASLSAWIDNF
jgi:hypothetical protein